MCGMSGDSIAAVPADCTHLQHSERASWQSLTLTMGEHVVRRYATCAPHKFTRLPNPSILVPVSIERRRRQRPTFLSAVVHYELRALKLFLTQRVFSEAKSNNAPNVFSTRMVSGFSVRTDRQLLIAAYFLSLYEMHLNPMCVMSPSELYSICICS